MAECKISMTQGEKTDIVLGSRQINFANHILNRNGYRNTEPGSVARHRQGDRAVDDHAALLTQSEIVRLRNQVRQICYRLSAG